MTKEKLIEEIAELAIAFQETEYGNTILGSDKEQQKRVLVTQLDEVHSLPKAEDPRIR